MAVPRETNKEIVVVVDNESLDVVITPPVIDSAIVVGQPPPADSRTMLFDGYVDDNMRLKTIGGLNFQVSSVQEVPASEPAEQVMFGYGHPGTLDGQFNNRIYIDRTNKGFYIWSGDVTDWDNPQLIVVSAFVNLPGSANNQAVCIVDSTNSIYVWSD